LVDSGCTISTTSNVSFFYGPFNPIRKVLRFLVGSITATAEGFVQVHTSGGVLRWQAICVEGAPFDLVSVSGLAAQGYDCFFDDKGLIIRDRVSSKIVATGTLKQGLYFLDCLDNAACDTDHAAHTAAATPTPPVLTRLPASATLRTPSPTTLLVWHYRTCHIPLRLLKRMAKEQSVLGLHIVLKHSEEFPCVACLKGKLTAPHLTPAGPKPRRSALRVSEQTLSRASLDAFGPLRCRGFDRSLYIIVIILADSKKLFSYTLPDLKDGTVRKFLDMFLTRLTKETDGQLLRNLHSDNFASFKSNQAYAASRGCHWEYITPRSSQQNPAERAIQYVMNALRTVMLASGLPRYLFPTVLQAVLFCLNLTPPPKDDDSFLDEDGILSREEVNSATYPTVPRFAFLVVSPFLTLPAGSVMMTRHLRPAAMVSGSSLAMLRARLI
jgi:hypothetical protein